jgi:hypothetical protein
VPSQPFTPETTLVAILGASEWPSSPELPSSEAFRKSAQDFEAYFRGHPFNLRPENLCYLFDHKGSPLEINRELSEFLTRAQERATRDGRPIRDLILYYVGHGGFTKGGDQAYFLALRSTEVENEGVSSLRMVDLAGMIRHRAKDLRRYLILDCCFAEQAYQYYQSSSGGDPAKVAHTKALLEFPDRGTALLCSSSKRDFSIAPTGEPHTMFSGALLDVLQTGDVSLETALSLENLGHRVTRLISTKYPDIAVRPKVSSPDQREGNVADIPLFPNAAHLVRSADERLANSERKLELILEKLQILDDLCTRLPALQALEIKAIQIALKGILTKHELGPLEGLNRPTEFMLPYEPELYGYLHRLDGLNFIQPNPGYGLIDIVERHKDDLKSEYNQRKPFDLKEFVYITDDGRRYLNILSDILKK